MTIRVVEWSTGYLGAMAIEAIDNRPELELVGVHVSDPAKVGVDAGRLAGLDRDLGVAATDDRASLLALEPDVVVYTAETETRFTAAIEDFTEFLRAGIDVVASGPVLFQYPHGTLPNEMIETVVAAGREGGATLHVNGIDPGFANDVLPLAMTSLSRRIDHIRVGEIADYSVYHQGETMRRLFGFGGPMGTLPPLLRPGMLAAGWGSVVRQLAAALDVTLDEPLVERHERLPAERDLSLLACEVPAGTQAALRFELVGQVDGKDRIVLEHVTRTAADQAPDWPRPDHGDGCYRIEITGEPTMRVEFGHHAEHGDHNVSGMLITAMRLVNAVEAVVAAEPGLAFAKDLPMITGRGLMTT
ncbi:diacylglycerol kinase [Dietzia sp. ANT_WB102]|uniref:NAD(P)H-dependent amine dehydrogenase family protein n=1 Tax=Dietzia sp. ANT_WB102 TaxID=2597345 RepID=UPI0011EE7035|nr:diacylglycerol kinase [Dietzia sp. ANT_WB102]KAA0918659.1 diacylglycerol kinase [Dietzia sp. ANT_WB102]